MSESAVRAIAIRLRDWAVAKALPLWASVGFDEKSGRFCEALTLEGQPASDMPIRLIVQARQVFSYALAMRRGWFPQAEAIVEKAYHAMVRDYYRADGKPGWVYSISREGTTSDPKRDLYSHAFALLAISAYVGATGRRSALALADETLSFLDASMRAPVSGGYVESLPPTDEPRRQNPHMHLFESLLSLWSNSGEGRYIARAGEMFGLFSTRFFHADTGVVGEYFDNRLAPAAGDAGKIVEPGHHSEWIWLLRWYERETGQALQSYVDPLYEHAARYGYDLAGLMVDELLVDGTCRQPSHRTWPMTEALKANLAEAKAGRAGAAAKAAEVARLLDERFFAVAPAGGWMDRLDAEGKPTAKNIPASTLYHVLCAIDELDQFARAA
jgi:mannose-6-phosphate isomerase